MTELFAASRRIDEERSVSVVELADTTIAIEGVTAIFGRDATRGAVRLSPEATEQVRQILNEWHECNKEVK